MVVHVLMTKTVMFVGALGPTEELIVKVLYSYGLYALEPHFTNG